VDPVGLHPPLLEFKKKDLVKYIKINRMKMGRHIIRMANNRRIKRMFETRPEGKREIGRPEIRWAIVWARF
jgi:hypothetical protein